ncbi:MAG: signal peptidase I [Actinomycetota bacterium]|nr:signal peptidase I [Actinomycetota bacterium]
MRGHSRWEIPLILLLAVLLVFAFTAFVAKPFSIPSGSMESTLQIGDRVLVNRFDYRFGQINRGDVVVFDGTDSFVPAASLSPRDPITSIVTAVGQAFGVISPDGTDFVKRVIGVAGDRVQCCDVDGKILVNGQAIVEPYVFAGDPPSTLPFNVLVPAGKIWVMGDHRSQSADSRAHLGDPGGGMVPESKVIGRVMAVIWPPARWGAVSGPDTYAKVSQ